MVRRFEAKSGSTMRSLSLKKAGRSIVLIFEENEKPKLSSSSCIEDRARCMCVLYCLLFPTTGGKVVGEEHVKNVSEHGRALGYLSERSEHFFRVKSRLAGARRTMLRTHNLDRTR